jgi:long-chain acyl-CoA synthetase
MSNSAEPRPWLASYPKQAPAEIDLGQISTLDKLLTDAAAVYGDRDAFESFGKSITFAEVGRAGAAFAAALQAKGLKKGDRVALMMPNILAYPVALAGVLIGGFTVVNVNPLYTPRELAHQLTDSGARAIVVIENFAHVVQEALPEVKLQHIFIATPGDLMGFKGHIVNFVSRKVKKAVKPFSLPGAASFAAAAAGSAKPQPADVQPDDVAFLQYTGGTTGVAKGATLTHRNVHANVQQCQAWFEWSFRREGDTPNYQHTMVTALPLYHIFALTCCCLFMIRIGAKCLLIANPRDIDGFIKTLKTSRFTLMSGVNTLYNALLNHKDFATLDVSNLRLAVAGGMATQGPVANRWKETTSVPIVEGYGLSETSPVACVNRPDIEAFTGTIGYPVASTDVSIRGADGSVLPLGEPGELCIKGPQVMKGYWNRPDETAKVMTADGFFRSGDIAVQNPDGSFKIVDRAKDMVLVSGFNVYPNEVEDVLAGNPKVLESAVIGLPDEQSGEQVVAYVVLKPGQSATPEEIRSFCKESLTGYKVPRQVKFREALPKTNVGKVLRRSIRDEEMKALKEGAAA